MDPQSVERDPASFRDPTGFVYRKNGKLFRSISERTVFLESSVVLGKDQALKIRLPALKTPARLEFSLRYSPVTQGKLILLENEAELAEISVKEPKTLKISTVLPQGNARTVKLQFRFLPRRGNREEMHNYRIFLLGAGLHSL